MRQIGIWHAPGFLVFLKLSGRGKAGYVQSVSAHQRIRNSMKKHPLFVIVVITLPLIIISGWLGFTWQQRPFLNNLFAGFIDIGLGTFIGVFLVNRLVKRDRQEKWSRSRNYILGAIAAHLSDFSVEALISMPINDLRPMTAIIDGRNSPNPATVTAIRKVANFLRDINKSPSVDRSLSDYVFDLYDSVKWDLDQIQTVLTPWIIQSEADPEIIDAMMIFDKARRQLHNAIISDKLISTGAAYPTLIEFIDAGADLYNTLSKHWNPLPKKT